MQQKFAETDQNSPGLQRNHPQCVKFTTRTAESPTTAQTLRFRTLFRRQNPQYGLIFVIVKSTTRLQKHLFCQWTMTKEIS
jgi:hypothetical protein